jgi:protein-S-isoprenylcysteine O-methyltransferase Ste14
LGGISFLGQIILCVTAYNFLGLDRLLYLGWTLLAIALLIGMSARRTFQEAAGESQEDTSFESDVIVDSGWYGIVRHPIYLSFIGVIVSLMLISQHWLSIILGLPWIVYLYLSMISVERIRFDRFGEPYQDYMAKVPRVNLVLGGIRYWQRRRTRK